MVKLLVIEDETLLLEEVVEILTFEGFEVYGAENGAMGIEMVYQHRPDLILCDIMMPVMDGYQVLMSLQSDHQTRLIPFMFITAKSAINDIRVGMNLGADDYVTKPFTRDTLLEAIETRLEKHRVIADMIDSAQDRIDHLQGTIMMSLPHELRTPLSSITGYSEILAEDVETMSPAQIRTMITGVQRGAKRLHRLIENYLLFAQLQIRRYQEQELQELIAYYKQNPIHVHEYISSMALQKAQQYQREDDLQIDIAPVGVALPADEVKKIVSELTDNAFKFSEPGTPVQISMTVENDIITLIFEDHGRGMTTQQIEQIGAYMQFDRMLHEQQGLGLGLTIARMLVELFGGTFDIQSEPEAGTRIIISFSNN